MITVQNLKECFKLNFEIKAIEEMLEGLRNDRERITRNYEALGVQTSQKIDYADLTNTIVDMEEVLDEKIKELSKIRNGVIQKIYSIKEAKYRTLLIDRYVNKMSWDEMTETMHYGRDYLYKLHGEALERFERGQ